MILFYSIMAFGYLVLALSPYYRMTALILAASCGVGIVVGPYLAVESGLIYTLQALLELAVLTAILKWGDEGKFRQSILIGSAITLNTLSVFDYYGQALLGWEGLLNQSILGLVMYFIACAQLGVLSGGYLDSYRVLRGWGSRLMGNEQSAQAHIRIDP